jgi:ketosteroid isomerase-like protein
MKQLLLLKIIIITSFITPVLKVTAQIDIEQEKQKLLQVDIDFSNYSKLYGVNKAILKYVADDGVLLRTNHYPIVGIDKVKEFFQSPDTSFVLTWLPSFVDIAVSGELGYTYGLYKLQVIDENGQAVIYEGTYVSIWKKDKEGNWKFVLDTGNSRVEKKK